ncbi:MAG: L,D-transpeptidase family protein [Actinomycetes bacterium]
MSAPRLSAVAVAVVALVGSLLVAGTVQQPGLTASAQAATALPLPARLTSLDGARQAVVVTSRDWSTSFARLQTWQLGGDGVWRQVMSATRARLGWNGFAPAALRRQGSGETPAGTFGLLRGFGTTDPGGVQLPYRVVDLNDWWPYDPTDPKTYNVMQLRRPPAADWRSTWAEHLAGFGHQYLFAVVIDYNLPQGIVRTTDGERIATDPANTRKGGGIFLHVSGGGPTAGCVSVRRADMRRIIRWLDPQDSPRIVMGPRGTLS